MPRPPRAPHSAWPACAASICLGLLVTAASANVSEQAQTFTSVRTMPTPFLFNRLVQPAPGFQRVELETWMERVKSHRPGQTDASVTMVAAMLPAALSNVISAFEWEVGGIKPVTARLDVIGRAAVLHTDIALASDRDTPQDEVSVSDAASLHLGAAMELVDVLKREAPGGARDPVVLNWWRAVCATLSIRRETVSAPAFMQRAVALLPADTEVLLMAGALHELLATPAIRDGEEQRERVRVLWGSVGDNRNAAERCYRKATDVAPALAEARVRLGRILVDQKEYGAAVSELQRAVVAGSSGECLYLAYLFLGEAQEAGGQLDAARDAYRKAVSLYPDAQSVHLALARLERRAGQRESSAAAVRHVLDRASRPESSDPWHYYYIPGPARRASEFLEAVRAPFRRPQ